MIEIQIAGAGAGKTFGLAQSILNNYSSNTHKKIFALTYTNAAKQKISEELIRHFGVLPEGIVVETVHSFLLNEVIYPYSPFVLNEEFSSASTVKLKDKFKASEIKKLKSMHIMHADEVYPAARRVLDENHSRHSNAEQKRRVKRVLHLISTGIKKIYLDEAQDLDATALDFFEILGVHSVDLYMIGDPKQAIKFPKAFSEFLTKCEKSTRTSIKVLPFNNNTRRVPAEILSVSNLFCPKKQRQNSLSGVTGVINYIDTDDTTYESFITGHIKKGSIVCIEKKSGPYGTQKDSIPRFHPDIEALVLQTCIDKDPDIFLEAALIKFHRQVELHGAKPAVNSFFKEYEISYSAKAFAQVIQGANQVNGAKYKISSIESIKGLESETCILVLTPSTYKYLTMTGLSAPQRHNKIWKMIYVALTRAQKQMIVALDYSLYSGTPDKGALKKGLEDLGFAKYSAETSSKRVVSQMPITLEEWRFSVSGVSDGYQGIATKKMRIGNLVRIYGAIAERAEDAEAETKQLISRIGRMYRT